MKILISHTQIHTHLNQISKNSKNNIKRCIFLDSIKKQIPQHSDQQISEHDVRPVSTLNAFAKIPLRNKSPVIIKLPGARERRFMYYFTSLDCHFYNLLFSENAHGFKMKERRPCVITDVVNLNKTCFLAANDVGTATKK